MRTEQTYIRTRRLAGVYEIERRAGSASEHFRVYTLRHTVVRAVIWSWACGDPSWTVAVPWRRVDPESPGIDAASGLEILQDELSATTSGMTPDALALLDTYLAVRDTPISTLDVDDLAIDPTALRELGSAHTAQALPIAEAETPDDPDDER